MSDKEDREWAKNTLKTAKKGSAARIEAMGILSGDDPEKREYRKTTRENKNKLKGSKDNIGMMGGGYMKKNMMGGGPLKTVDVKNNPGLAKLPTPVRNKMGFAKDGGKVYNKKHGGKVIKNNMSGENIVKACYVN